MNKCIIYEVYKGNSFDMRLNESQVGVPEGMMRVTGIAAVIGVKNRNGRIYNKENYLHHIQLLQEDIAYGLYGELEHPENFTIDLNNVSHKIEKVWFDPATNQVMITILLLDTPKGKIAQSIIKSGGSIRVSSRAMGNVNKNHEAIITKLVTYDIVGTPGFRETDLRLSESLVNATPIHESSLCESFYINVSEEQMNECMKVTYDGDILSLNNHINKVNMNKNKNLKLLESKLQPSGNGSNLNLKALSSGITRFLNEEWAPLMVQWIADEFMPLYESYLSRKAINESLGKGSCSFGAFYRMQAAEAMRLYESQQPQNGTIVLSQEEQEVLQKCMQGQQLTEEEQQLAQQAQQKLQQNIEEAYQPQNGTIVLSEAEEQALQKLQQGEQLTEEEMQQAQQGLQKQQKMQQQQQQQDVNEGQQQLLTQEEQHCLQKFMQGQQLTQRQQQICQQAQQKLQQQQERLQQDGQQQQQRRQQGRQQISQQEQELRESFNDLNSRLTASYRRLIESEDPQEQEKINQEIDQLKQECDDVKQQIDSLSEGQSQQYKVCQQKIQQGQELSEDDLDGLTQDEIEDLIQQQKQQNESSQDYDDPNDAKVFEQAQLTQEEQQVVKKQQKGEQLTQEEQELFKQAQQKIEQQQLPENDKEVNESLISKNGNAVVAKSGSLLESLQKRMGMALDPKN